MRKTCFCFLYIFCLSFLLTCCGNEKDSFEVRESDIKPDSSIQIAKMQSETGNFDTVCEYECSIGGTATDVIISYADDGSRLTVVSEEDGGEENEYEVFFDKNGNIIRSEGADGAYSTYSYECNLIKTSNFNKDNVLQSTILSIYGNDLSVIEEYEFDSDGAVSKHKTVEYNNLDRIKTSVTTTAGGAVTTTKQLFDEEGRVVSATTVSDSSSAFAEYGYDENGELYRFAQQSNSALIQHGNSCSVTNEKDANGNLVKREYTDISEQTIYKSCSYKYTGVKYRHYVLFANQMIDW